MGLGVYVGVWGDQGRGSGILRRSDCGARPIVLLGLCLLIIQVSDGGGVV